MGRIQELIASGPIPPGWFVVLRPDGTVGPMSDSPRLGYEYALALARQAALAQQQRTSEEIDAGLRRVAEEAGKLCD